MTLFVTGGAFLCIVNPLKIKDDDEERINPAVPLLSERTAQLSAFRVAAMRILVALSVFSTRLTGFTITPHGVFHLLHAQIGVFLLLLPVALPLFVRLAAMAWVAGAVRLALGKD